jgi:hypothetical protein
MAGNPGAVPLVIGLDVAELSLTPLRLPEG